MINENYEPPTRIVNIEDFDTGSDENEFSNHHTFCEMTAEATTMMKWRGSGEPLYAITKTSLATMPYAARQAACRVI